MSNNPAELSHPTNPPTGTPGLFCVSCGGARLRRSRLRREDGWPIATLRWPVRCLQCNRRVYVSWLQALHAASAKTPHLSASTTQSWQSFTSGEAPVLREGVGKRDA